MPSISMLSKARNPDTIEENTRLWKEFKQACEKADLIPSFVFSHATGATHTTYRSVDKNPNLLNCVQRGVVIKVLTEKMNSAINAGLLPSSSLAYKWYGLLYIINKTDELSNDM